MRIRVITGLVFVLVMFASLMFGTYIFTLFVFALSILAVDEFYRLVSTPAVKPQKITGIALAISIYLPLYQYFIKGEPARNLLLAVPFFITIVIAELYRKHPNPFHNIAYTLLGVVYITVPFCFFYALAFLEGSYNIHYPLAFLLLLWSSDSGAYLFGSQLARHKLFERHSPKKSWEGFFGGLLTSSLFAIAISFYFTELALIHWLIVSWIIVVVGTFGDLSESMLKRSLYVKDSGSLLPGHGGVLDRFDGLLLAAPLVFVYLFFLYRF